MSLERRTIAKFIADCIQVATEDVPQEFFGDIRADVAGVDTQGATVRIALSDGRVITLDVSVEH